jgi:hypothetical protein
MGPLEIPEPRWRDNIKMDFKKKDGRAWIGLI